MKEYWIDDAHLILYESKVIDESFGHGFGVQKDCSIEVEIKSVIAYIGGMDFDITSSINSKWLRLWTEDIREKECHDEKRKGL